jgi:ribonucleoside-diphosphate reductase alpha chain
MTEESLRLGLRRVFSSEGVDPESLIEWEVRDARLVDHRDGSVAFEQLGVEVPASWSQNATNIVAQKYFRGRPGTSEREHSVRQIVGRIANTITTWGRESGYFADDAEEEVFRAELSTLLLTQRMAFNSPVWFNIGVDGTPNQSSACFILSVEDSMDSILNWVRNEGIIFKGGSGAGVNLSAIRSSREHLSGGGTPSGPVSFMRGADASAGTIKSGGKTRRAAKMVILDVDHPDIMDFVRCKAREERKIRALRDAGFDVDLNGEDAHSIQYQNANNSVRVTDEFMAAVKENRLWELHAVTTGEVLESLPARDIMRAIAEAAWECADPGVQYDTTINRWHTTPNAGRINGSNPCSEYMHVDNSACNLASLNLLQFLDENGSFDVDGFRNAVEITFIAQEILVGRSDYPTPEIAENARRFRQLGMGFTNLGAALMALGLPYDAPDARAWAGAVTAIMTGQCYATSARMAARLGPFEAYAADADATLGVLRMHREQLQDLDASQIPLEMLVSAQRVWDEACDAAQVWGVRNAQATVIAPTGTISFLLDCDTTGIEPDLGLVKMKKLVGGGTISIVNRTIPRALRRLGYSPEEVAAIEAWVAEHKTMLGAPHLEARHLEVFACSMGDNVIGPEGHLRMMGAVQPFISGAISKTVNLPEEATADEIFDLYVLAWQLGLKAVAVYRDNCKVGQPLSTGPEKPTGQTHAVDNTAAVAPAAPVRQRLPRSRRSSTFEFRVADCKGFVTVGEYDDGRPGELFIRVSKQGSTLAGIMDAFAIAVSHGLQYGVPLRAYVNAFIGMRFEPAGITDDPDLRIANSLMDYLFRRLALEYLTPAERAELGVFSVDERQQPTLPGVEEQTVETSPGLDIRTGHAPLCMQCGVQMVRAGSCFACVECGATSGCS